VVFDWKYIERLILEGHESGYLLFTSRALLRALPLIFNSRVSQSVSFSEQIFLPVICASEFSWVAATLSPKNTEFRRCEKFFAAISEDAVAFCAEMDSVIGAHAEYERAEALALLSEEILSSINASDKEYAADLTLGIISSIANFVEDISPEAADEFCSHLFLESKRLVDLRSYIEFGKGALWGGKSMPDTFELCKVKMFNELISLDENWEVWIDWYEDRLRGKIQSEELSISRLSVQADVWGDGARFVNYQLKNLNQFETARDYRQDACGPIWVADDGCLNAVKSGDDRDEFVLSDLKTQQLYEISCRKIEEFSSRYPNIENDHGWDGFQSCLSRVQAALTVPIMEIPKNIIGLYDAAVELGSYLDLQNDLLRRGIGNQSPLDPLVARAFGDLVRTTAIFVRTFPSALEADEAVSGFLTRPDIFDPAMVVIEAAGRRLLISRNDADWVLGLLSAGKRDGFPSQKAGNRGAHGARNLVVSASSVVAGFLMGAVASDFSTKSPLVQGASDFLAETENEITELLAQGQADIRHAISALIEENRKSNPTNKQPKFALEESNASRREEDEDGSTETGGGGGGGSWG